MNKGHPVYSVLIVGPGTYLVCVTLLFLMVQWLGCRVTESFSKSLTTELDTPYP